MNQSWREHGWLVFSLCAICGIIFGATLTSLGQLLEPIRSTFGWSSEQASELVSAYLLTAGLSPLLAGWFIDRFSVKWIMAVGVLMTGAGFAVVGLMSHWTGMLVALAISGAGVGASTFVPAMSIVSRRIPHLMGSVSGFLMAASSLGSAIFPPITGFSIDAMGWRFTMLAIGSLLAVLCLALLVSFVSNTSRAVEFVPGHDDGPPALHPMRSILSQRFITLITIQVLFGLGFMGLYVFFVPFLNGQGYSTQNASWIYAGMNLLTVPGAIVAGRLADRTSAVTVLLGSLLVNGLGIALLQLSPGLHGWPFLAMSVFALGLTSGNPQLLAPVIIGRSFGYENFGTLNGTAGFFSGLSAAGGPALTAIIYDRTGSYLTAFEVGAALMLAAAATALLMHRRFSVHGSVAAHGA